MLHNQLCAYLEVHGLTEFLRNCLSVKLWNLMGTVGGGNTVHIPKNVHNLKIIHLYPPWPRAIKCTIYSSINHVTHSATARVAQVFGSSATSNKSFPTAVLSLSNCACTRVIIHLQTFFFSSVLRLLVNTESIFQITCVIILILAVQWAFCHFLVRMHNHSTANFMLHSL